MAHVKGSIRIDAPLERVFDTVADSRNEPSFNPAMREVELLTPEPVGLGARFRARMSNSMELLEEITLFDRPDRLGSVITSSTMETSGTLTFAAEAGVTVMTWDWQVRPRGWLRVFGLLVGPMGRRRERRIWDGLKRDIEGVSGPRDE